MMSGADEKVTSETARPGEKDAADRFPLLAFLEKGALPPGRELCPSPMPEPARTAQVLSGAYKLRVLALAALGFAYVCGVLLVLSLLLERITAFIVRSPDPLVFLLVLSPILLILAALLYGTIRTVWIRTPVPEGFEITTFDSPELFGTLDLIRMELEGPEIHGVLLTGDFNASIAHVPRAGIFGWHRNYLVLGLPLLQALSPRQMLAVLAHEYGHLSGKQGRLKSRVCEVRKSWMQIHRKLATRSGFKEILLSRFFLWYAPYFQSATMPLARAHEYEADLCSVAIAGKDQTAAALIRFEVLSRFLHENFWPTIYTLRDTLPEPVSSVYGLMQEKFLHSPDRRTGTAWLEMSLAEKTGPEDSHPCLRERLSAIGEPPVIPASPSGSAAQCYFPRLEELRTWLDDEWRALVDEEWRARYEHVRTAKNRLSELVTRARVKPLSAAETLELANLTEDLSGRDEAFPFYQRILEYLPRFVPALCAVGRIWLAKGDESGVSYIEKAMALDPSFSIHGLEVLYNFYMAKGDREKTGKYYQQLYEQRESMERARKSRKGRRLPARYMVPRQLDTA